MKIEIKFPSNFQSERSYTLGVLFSYFKNIDLILLPENRNDYEINWRNESLVIEDHFWQELPEHSIDELWSRSPNQPMKLDVPELNTAIISTYGEPKLIFKKNDTLLKSDIIASSFFFLSRWEEWASNKRDEHDRFPDDESYLVQHKLHLKPLVNEYIELLRLLLSNSSDQPLEYNRAYQAYITHDVDEIFRYKPSVKWMKAIAGDLISRRDPFSACKTFFKGLFTQFSDRFDDSQTFGYLMNISEKYDLKSHFYFIPGEKGETDFRYSISSKSVKKLIQYIFDRDHVVGIHPSYRSKESSSYFQQEVSRLRNVFPVEINEGRHHYLRMNYPTTMKEWQSNDLHIDSSLGFTRHAGFRAGMCYEFPIFDLDSREVMNVIERPITIMEVALKKNTKSYEEFKQQVQELADVVYLYKGDFVFLWHNNNIHHPVWKKLGQHYEELINIIAK